MRSYAYEDNEKKKRRRKEKKKEEDETGDCDSENRYELSFRQTSFIDVGEQVQCYSAVDRQ